MPPLEEALRKTQGALSGAGRGLSNQRRISSEQASGLTSSLSNIGQSLLRLRNAPGSNQATNVPATTSKVPTSTPSPTPVATRISGGERIGNDLLQNRLNQLLQPVDEDAVRTERRNRAQSLIDTINAEFGRKIQDEREAGRRREDRGRALAGNLGQGGSSFASARATNIEDLNRERVGFLEQERASQIASILSGVEQDADDEIEAKRARNLQEFGQIFDIQDKIRSRANDRITSLGQQGVKPDVFKQSEPELYDKLLRQSGLSEFEFDQKLNAENPAGERDEFQFQELKSGRIGVFNKSKGSFEEIEVEGGLQANEELKIVDGRPFAQFTNEQGNIELRPVKGFTPQAKEADPLNRLQLFDRERSLSKDFLSATAEARDASRQLGQMKAGLQLAKDTGDLNAASQAVLVTFQKILDPTSVVRESEYARSGSGLSLAKRIAGKAEQIKAGGAGVKTEDLEEFVRLGEEFYKGYQNTTLQQAQLIRNQAQSIGADIERVLPTDARGLLDDLDAGRLDEGGRESGKIKTEDVDDFLDNI